MHVLDTRARMHVTSAARTVDPDEHDGLEEADDEQREGADYLVDEREDVDASVRDHRERAEEGEDKDDEAEDNVAEAAFSNELAELILYGAHDALDERELHRQQHEEQLLYRLTSLQQV